MLNKLNFLIYTNGSILLYNTKKHFVGSHFLLQDFFKQISYGKNIAKKFTLNISVQKFLR